jgi:hypothetical protein
MRCVPRDQDENHTRIDFQSTTGPLPTSSSLLPPVGRPGSSSVSGWTVASRQSGAIEVVELRNDDPHGLGHCSVPQAERIGQTVADDTGEALWQHPLRQATSLGETEVRAMRHWLFLLVASLGCSDNAGTPALDMAGGGGPGDGGGGGSTDFAVGPNDIVLEMDPFPVAAGEEVFRCQNFANPLGADIEVQQWDSVMTTGSHHLLVFYQPNATNGALENCNGLEFKSGPFGAQTPTATVAYPPGVAAVIPANQGLRFASHYLNASQNAITAKVKVIIRRATPGSVQNRAAIFFFNNIAIFVAGTPAGMQPKPVMVSKTCRVPRDMFVMYSVGHMHRHATNITAKVGNEVIYSTDSWDNAPFQEYAPPRMLKANTDITFTCTYLNPNTTPLTFGESAETNEMCIFDGQFYPDPTGQGFSCQ